MGVIRAKKNRNYSVMSNFHLRDKRLCWKTRGLLSTILSLPDKWDYSIAGLAELTGDGVSSVRTALKDLEKYGYLERRALRKNGKICDWEYLIYEHPIDVLDAENPLVENPNVEKSHAENQMQSNTYEVNIKKSKTYVINYEQIKDLFNETCVSFPRLTVLSDNRKKAIKARLNSGYTEDDFKRLFEEAENSSFLKGANNRNWQATFDWLIKDSNMAKVLDGNYRDKEQKAKEKEDEFVLKGVRVL